MKSICKLIVCTLIFACVTSCSYKTNNGIPEDYNLLDKTKVLLGNHSRSQELYKYAVSAVIKDNRLKLSQDICDVIIENDEKYWPAYFLKGFVFFCEGSCKSAYECYSLAEMYYDKSIELNNPEDDQYMLNMRIGSNIMCYASRDNFCKDDGLYETPNEAYHDAIEYINKALSYNPKRNEYLLYCYVTMAISNVGIYDVETAEIWADEAHKLIIELGYNPFDIVHMMSDDSYLSKSRCVLFDSFN